MLDQTDIDRVSAYIYEDFPKLKGRVAVRRFDAPLELRFLEGGLLDAALDDCKPRIREDFLDQFEPGRERVEAGYAIDAVFRGGGILAGAATRDSIAKFMHRKPAASELTAYFDKAVHSTGYYYITQYPSKMDDAQMLAEWIGTGGPYRAPAGMARIAGMFALAHEFTHVAHSVLFVENDRRAENLCDGVAAACVLRLEGAGAKLPLSYIRDGRLRAEAGSPHDTGLFLLHLLGDKSFSGTMGAAQALEHAKRLYDRLNPAVRPVASAPAPAL